MKTAVECLSCFLRQTIRTTDLLHCSSEKQYSIVQEVMTIISKMDSARSPVANSRPVYEKISEMTGCLDPYLEIKKQNNRDAKEHLILLKPELEGEVNQLELAVRFAIAGNIIDYGALKSFDLHDVLSRCRTRVLAVDNIDLLKQKIKSLPKGATILYLADNCGEIVYDALLIEWFFKRDYNIIVAVKDSPIINDALLVDAVYAGIDQYARLITNGTNCPGTVLDECSDDFCDIFNGADLVIAKGQGNFESLSEVAREVFFLLTVKCIVAAKHMVELSGVDPALLPGKGEMAVYYSKEIKGCFK